MLFNINAIDKPTIKEAAASAKAFAKKLRLLALVMQFEVSRSQWKKVFSLPNVRYEIMVA